MIEEDKFFDDDDDDDQDPDPDFPFVLPRKKREVPGLDKFGIDLTLQARLGKMDPVIGRKKQTEELIEVLCRRRKNNAVLLGEPGVGKTAVAEGLAQKIANGDVPSRLLYKRIISLDLSLMIAGTRYRGEFEARLRKVIDEAKADPNIILVIDEMHNLIGAGSAEGAMDAANILKPPLARGELQCIGATTRDEYKRYVERDAALQRRFQPIDVPEPTVEETIEILRGLRDRYEIFHNVKVTEEGIVAAAQFSAQYIADRFLPDKAIDLLDQSGARASLKLDGDDGASRLIEKEREALRCIYLLKCEALRKNNIDAIKPLNDLEEFWRADLLRFLLERQMLEESKKDEQKRFLEKDDIDEKILKNNKITNKTSIEKSIGNDNEIDFKENNFSPLEDLYMDQLFEPDLNFEIKNLKSKLLDQDYSRTLDQLIEKDIKQKAEQKEKEKEKRKKEQQQRLEKREKLNLNKNGWYDEENKEWYLPKDEEEVDEFLDTLFLSGDNLKKYQIQSTAKKLFKEIDRSKVSRFLNCSVEEIDQKIEEANLKQPNILSFLTERNILEEILEKDLIQYLKNLNNEQIPPEEYFHYIYKSPLEFLSTNGNDKIIKPDSKKIWKMLMKEIESAKKLAKKSQEKTKQEKDDENQNKKRIPKIKNTKELVSSILEMIKKTFFGLGNFGEKDFFDWDLQQIIDYYGADSIPGSQKSIERTQHISQLLEELPRHIDWAEALTFPDNPKYEGEYLNTSINEELERITNSGLFSEEEKEAIKERMSVQEVARQVREKYSFIAKIAEKIYFEDNGIDIESENEDVSEIDYSENLKQIEEEEEEEREQLRLLNERIKELFGPDTKPLTRNKIIKKRRFKPLIEREVLEELRQGVAGTISDTVFEKIYYELSDPTIIKRLELGIPRKIGLLEENVKKDEILTKPQIGKNQIAELISIQTGVPLTELTQDESKKLKNLESILHTRVIGQNEAVSAVANAVRRARTGIRSQTRPIASFMFCGPTGVGKTELTKTLASVMFGSEESIIRLDMSEYMEKHAVAQLLGAPPGYIGYSEGGQLTEKVRRRPYSVVLFDEIEKAHPDILDILLQLLDDGRLTDAQGRLISFKNTIIILTSNVGAHQVQEHLKAAQLKNKNFDNLDGLEELSSDNPLEKESRIRKENDTNIGFIKKSDLINKIFIKKDDQQDNQSGNFSEINENKDSDYLQLKEKVFDELKVYYRPEFLNRLDDVIVFKQLSKKEVRQIAEILIQDLIKRIKEQGYKLVVTDSAKNQILEEGYDPLFGARPLRRAITRIIENGISEALVSNIIAIGDTLCVDYEKNGFKINKLNPEDGLIET